MAQNLETVSDGMLEVLGAYGVECIFSSPGTEWVSLWDSVARTGAEGVGPRFFNIRHEDLAVSIAAGYYLQSGKLPVVPLHTTVGTLHAAMALRGAYHQRIPMVVLAGDSAGFGEMPGLDPGHHWARTLSDVGGSDALARPFVKRSSTVTCREVFLGMLQDACRLALTPPYGPVFLSVPFEYAVGPCPKFESRCAPPPLPTRPDTSALEDVAKQLVQAERPVLLTEYAGRDPRNVALLVELAECLALPVVEAHSPGCLNFPRDHALHQGSDAEPLTEDADLVVLVGNQMPWYPSSKRPKSARVIQIDDDPAHDLVPYWGYGVDQVIAGELATTLRELIGHVKSLSAGTGAMEALRRERRSLCEERHGRLREEFRGQALSSAQQPSIDGHWLVYSLGEALPADAIVAEETISHKPMLQRHLKRNLAGTFHCCSSGLGVGLGNALGLKVAAPDRLVALVIGDGAFNYNPVVAALGFAQQHDAPILVAVLDNRSYVSMKRTHLRYYPDGWASRTGRFVGAEITPTPDYAGLARLFGGYGERVEDPKALPDALRRAIGQVKAGQLALLDVILDTAG